MYILNIKWPKNEEDKGKLFLGFMVKVLETLGIGFPSELMDPLQHARNYLNQDITKEEYEKLTPFYWKYIDDRNGIREFRDKNILKARLGLVLCSATTDMDSTGEKLAWFLEVVEFLGINLDHPTQMMQEYFEFGKDD
jgi:hypothetical protein